MQQGTEPDAPSWVLLQCRRDTDAFPNSTTGGRFFSAGGRLQASFLRSVLSYLPDSRPRAELDRSIDKDNYFYFVRGALEFEVDADLNQCEIKLNIFRIIFITRN